VASGEVEVELVGVDGLLAGLAAAGPALEERLQQQYRSWECQADRGCASVTARIVA
jgi:hypothetical protein